MQNMENRLKQELATQVKIKNKNMYSHNLRLRGNVIYELSKAMYCRQEIKQYIYNECDKRSSIIGETGA